ncbi:hypothetical protein BC831DRAFT_452237 [Entophlyctis helioformis]|nr:hypothetical protein BC831DRAFT_452237 [Entophlyctis helioformis]
MRALDMNAAPLSKAAKDQQTLGGSQSLRKSNSALQPIATISVKPVTPQQLRQTQSSVSPATATLSAGQPSPTKTAAEAIEINQHHYRAISNTISNTSSYARGSRSPSATPAGAQDQQAWHHPAAVPINSAMHPSDERMSSQSAALTQSAHQQQQPVSILVTMPSFVSALPSSALPPHAPSSSFPLLPTTTRSGTHSGTHSRAHSGTHSLQSSAHSTQSYTGHSGTGRQGPMPETHVSGNPPDGGSARRNMRHNAAGSHSIDGLDSA